MKTTFCLVQDKYKSICLGLVQPKKPVRICNVHIAIQCTHCTFCTMYKLYKLLETSSAILCTHTVQLICSLTRENRSSFSSQAGPERGQLTARPTKRWEGPLSRVLLPFPCFQGFPALAGLGKQPLPGGVVLPVQKHRQDCQLILVPL